MSLTKRLLEQRNHRRSSYGLSSARVVGYRNPSQMSSNLADYEALNQDVSGWAKGEKRNLKGSLKGQKIRKTGELYRKLGARSYKRGGIVDRVGFKLLRRGVFVEKGVGKGRPAGSAKSEQYKKPWFNPVIDPAIPELADIAQMHYADISVKQVRIN